MTTPNSRNASLQKNRFCSRGDLRNEATVESFFVDRLVRALKYPDGKIRLKETLTKITIGRGSSKERYQPDYVLLDSGGMPKIVIEAKSPEKDIKKYHYQVSSYAMHLNQKHRASNPVLYTILTNGYVFSVYPWDSDTPVFHLDFEDFVDDNQKYLELLANVSYTAFSQVKATQGVFDFRCPSLNNLIKTFEECHNLIWKKDKISPTDAFYEFSKIMFIKIKEDAKINKLINDGKPLSPDNFIFSANWIESQSVVEPNPFDTILFRQIREDLEKQIKDGKKKRIFGSNENLNLKPSTILEVVKRLENYDLYRVDEDLNGRMFETFLNATVRGRGLGQYFTPRSIVHYMTRTATLSIKSFNETIPLRHRIPFILDGCCGSGGFLIDVMAHFMSLLKNTTRLTDLERTKYESEIKNNHIYGVEATEKISRIARLNMYLHGDGGSKIFQTDMLDKDFISEAGMAVETADGIKEFARIINEDSLKFDVVLSNPPFSMVYKSSDSVESRILKQYNIAKKDHGKTTSEKSNVLFLERYADLLKADTGELLTIIDDTVLNGTNSQKYRDFILHNFIIIQIVSLPFNTFFRAQASIKTSIIHLRKKRENETQGSIFMAITNNVGHDDHSRDTPGRDNLSTVVRMFEEWRSTGNLSTIIESNENPDESLSCPLQVFELPVNKLNPKRLDAFYYSPELENIRVELNKLKQNDEIVLYSGKDFQRIKEIRGSENDVVGNVFRYFEIGDVTRDGTIINDREDFFKNLPTRARLRVCKGDIIFAKNISSRGTTILIPQLYHNQLTTTGFVGIRPRNYEEALMLWSILESEIFRKQVYYLATTASQPELRSDTFNNEVLIPFPTDELKRKEIMRHAKAAISTRDKLRGILKKTTVSVEKILK